MRTKRGMGEMKGGVRRGRGEMREGGKDEDEKRKG